MIGKVTVLEIKLMDYGYSRYRTPRGERHRVFKGLCEKHGVWVTPFGYPEKSKMFGEPDECPHCSDEQARERMELYQKSNN